HTCKLSQDLLVKRGDAQVERQAERASAALEVLVELAAHLVERGAEHAHAEPAGELVLPAVAPVRDPGEAPIRHRDAQVAERRRDDVEPYVDEALADGGRTETGVEIRRDVHVSSSGAGRRTTPRRARPPPTSRARRRSGRRGGRTRSGAPPPRVRSAA